MPAVHNRSEDSPIGMIPVDALFSPISKVSYKVDNTRVGQVTNYDKLSMKVETNGAITPEDAVALAARILQDQLQLFINFEEPRVAQAESDVPAPDRKSTRLNSSHVVISYAVSCLKKKKAYAPLETHSSA